MDLRYGRTLPVHMAELELIDSGNEAVTWFDRGRSPSSQSLIQSFQPIDDTMVASGVITESDASDARLALEDPSFIYRVGDLVSVWGRKPIEAS
jgi:hypothetical protein